MQISRVSILITLCAALSGSTPAARAADKWPPLNAIEERQTNPVQVGNTTFTTGYYSYHVPEYSVPSLHYSKSINWGPREWWVIVGLGGDEPIGPRAGSSQPDVPQSTPITNSLPPVAPLPQSFSALPDVSALPAVPNLANLPSLPSLSP